MNSAKADCASNNAQIVVINSAAEYNFVNSMRSTNQDIWVDV